MAGFGSGCGRVWMLQSLEMAGSGCFQSLGCFRVRMRQGLQVPGSGCVREPEVSGSGWLVAWDPECAGQRRIFRAGLGGEDKKFRLPAVSLGVERVSWAMEISIGFLSGSVSVKLCHAATKEQLRKTTTTFHIFSYRSNLRYKSVPEYIHELPKVPLTGFWSRHLQILN